MSHSIAPIPVVETYFSQPGATPVIEQEFYPGVGWVTQRYQKRVSKAWLLKLRRAGVTSVALRLNGRLADFTVTELLRSY